MYEALYMLMARTVRQQTAQNYTGMWRNPKVGQWSQGVIDAKRRFEEAQHPRHSPISLPKPKGTETQSLMSHSLRRSSNRDSEGLCDIEQHLWHSGKNQGQWHNPNRDCFKQSGRPPKVSGVEPSS